MGVGDQRHAPAALPQGKTPVPIVQEAGWAPGPVWTGAEKLAPTEIRSPDRPASSESLYRLSYPGRSVIGRNGNSYTVCTQSVMCIYAHIVHNIETLVGQNK